MHRANVYLNNDMIWWVQQWRADARRNLVNSP